MWARQVAFLPFPRLAMPDHKLGSRRIEDSAPIIELLCNPREQSAQLSQENTKHMIFIDKFTLVFGLGEFQRRSSSDDAFNC